MADVAASGSARAANTQSEEGGLFRQVVERLVIGMPYLWMLIFFLVPFLIVFKISFSTTAIAMPPYTPVINGNAHLQAVADFLTSSFVWRGYIWLTSALPDQMSVIPAWLAWLAAIAGLAFAATARQTPFQTRATALLAGFALLALRHVDFVVNGALILLAAFVVLAATLWLGRFPLLVRLAVAAALAIGAIMLTDLPQKYTQFTVDNYTYLTDDPLYYRAYLSSLVIAAVSTVLTLLIAYPIAYGMARAPTSIRPTLLMLVILPFWTSFLIRVYAWIGILKPEGLLNQFLLWLGVIDTPLIITNTYWAIYIGIVYSYLPFMVLPLYAALEKMDYTLIEAANDLGCPPLKAFWKITFPLSVPGVIAGCMLVFIPAMGEFVIPDLLGGSDTLMIGKVLWNEFFSNRDWPVASAVAVVLLILLVVPIMFFQHYQAKAQEAGR